MTTVTTPPPPPPRGITTATSQPSFPPTSTPPPPPHRSASSSSMSRSSMSRSSASANNSSTTTLAGGSPSPHTKRRTSLTQLRLPKIIEEDGTQRILNVGIPNTNRCNNILITSKYTLWTFLPLVRVACTLMIELQVVLFTLLLICTFQTVNNIHLILPPLSFTHTHTHTLFLFQHNTQYTI
jgi:hypothetical protein